MKLVRVSDLFDIKYGDSLELSRLEKDDCGINFVSRTAKNNGVSAKVKRIPGIEPTPANTITVALSGSVLETFLQPEPFYSGYHIFCLTPKVELSDTEKLFYCACIRANQYRYNYGRQANRTLAELLIPSREEIPTWVNKSNVQSFEGANQPFTKEQTPDIDTRTWEWFKIEDLFEIKKGKRLTKAKMKKGNVPFIGSIDSNNGYREYIGQKPIHKGNTITVNYNGSVAEAFYQPQPFWASDDVNVLYPKFGMNQYIALFIVSLIKLERYRFNYGRKWHMERMKEARIKLPVTSDGEPDYEFMEEYIKSLPYSSSI